MKVAIIGAGPRGLWAAEELFERARQRGARIDLTVFNDGPLGSASATGAFQPAGPGQWLLNVPATAIESRLGSFNAWRGANDSFPPRRGSVSSWPRPGERWKTTHRGAAR